MEKSQNTVQEFKKEKVINEQIPSKAILEAFGLFGVPIMLKGGQDTCYRVEDIVLKPTNNNLETSWIADINEKLDSKKFRVPKPLRATNGLWIYQGWTASNFLEGEHRPEHYTEAVELSKIFHGALVDITKPEWFDKKTDVFAISDKIAWGELPLPEFEAAYVQLKEIFRLLKPNQLPNQLVHGDWGLGQILFHNELSPAVIDMTPYFRPANYPIADMLVSALDHEDADLSILDLGKNIKDFDQLLLRALVMRTCTYIEFQIHPENDHDWSPVITRHLNLFNPIVDKLEQYRK